MPSTSTRRTQRFVLRLQQLMDLYQLAATQFAQQIQVEPTSFCQLMALEPVEAEVVLAVIDQLHQQMKLDFKWFLTYDLAIIPDLSECLEIGMGWHDESRRVGKRSNGCCMG